MTTRTSAGKAQILSQPLSSSSLTLYLPAEDEGGVGDAETSLLPTESTARQTYIHLQRAYLRFLWFILHIGLVVLHLAILVVGIKGLELRAVFSVEHQARVSFIVTALSTGIGIGYSSTALFVTQKLAMQYNLRVRQTLTATHDSVAAWNGLGSALSGLYAQFKVPASVFGTLTAAVYLSCLALLHITSPAILSVEGFNVSVPVPVQTLGVPEFNNSVDISATVQFLNSAISFLPWIDNLESSQKIGLCNGSLYDTLQELAPGRGRARVNATAFNITCGYLPGVNSGFDSGQWNISLGSPETFEANILTTSYGPNVITANYMLDGSNGSLIVSTPNNVVDSHGRQGYPVELDPPMNYSITHLQFLQCWRTLVPQEGIVDGESGQLVESSVQPSVHKTRSTWHQYSNTSFPPSDSTLLGGDWWTSLPDLESGPTVILGNEAGATMLSVMDEFLMELLDLDPSWISTQIVPVSTPVLVLHDIENAISAFVATAFWLAGHVRADRLQMLYTLAGDTISGAELIPPTLVAGHTTVPQNSLRIRLKINIQSHIYILKKLTVTRAQINLIAVSIGLGVSILLGIVAFPYTFADSDSNARPPVDSISILQTIWILRRHDDLSNSLPQVAVPEETNLRTAGLVAAQLFGPPWETGFDDSTSNFHTRSRLFTSDPGSPSRSGSSSQRYKIMCISLHLGLVIIHLTLLAIIVNSHAEHAVIFSVQSQHHVSLWITLISTAIGTIYLAATLYVTQTLALRKCLGSSQTLTATHDQTLSWAGIGAAFSSLLAQFALPADIIGTLAITGYLATILMLHVSTPALFAVETFNHTVPAVVPTQGFPLWNGSDTNASSVFPSDLGDFLPWMSTLVNQSKTVGLFNGSLYDILAFSSSATTYASVSATGFNVTCGYLNNVSFAPSAKGSLEDGLPWNITLPNGFSFQPPNSGPNILTTRVLFDFGLAPTTAESWPSMLLYTTNKVVDSTGNTGLPVGIAPPMGPNSTVSELQLLQCSRSLIAQQAKVDPYSKLIIPSSLKPILHKTSSQWNPYEQPPQTADSNHITTLVNSEWPTPLHQSNVPMSIDNDSTLILFAWMDLYIMEALGLDPSWIQSGSVTSLPPVLYLHDIENALSSLLASYFWMVGHIRLQPLMVKYGVDYIDGAAAKRKTPVLTDSNTSVNQMQLASRLNINVIALLIGLSASVLCFLLSMQFMTIDSISGTSLTGMGILQVIWLFRNHPWLSTQLEQVVEPTNKALRAAGMIRVQLVMSEGEATEMRPLADGFCN